MEIKRGIPVSPGVAIGPALVLDTEGYRIPQRFVDGEAVAEEIQRMRRALGAAAAEAQANQRAVTEKLGSQYGAIFGAHALLVEDKTLARELESLIQDQKFAAEYAVSHVIRRYAKALESINRGHFATRASDFFDIERSILGHLLGQQRENVHDLKQPVIIVAHDLTPSETAAMDRRMVHAFATEAGGRASHTAIMAGALEIPAVVGIGKFLTDVSGGDVLIVDGNDGIVILDPDQETLRHYETTQSSFRKFETQLGELRDLPAQTRDGVTISLLGNIEFPEEAQHCLDRGATGVGLYRTEFLYLNKKTDPLEDEHYQAYMKVLETLGKHRPVVIRTLDLGADKFALASEPVTHERNPFLGLRSIRLCLRNLTLFKTQIRAILRASAIGDVRILFPMVSTLLEIRQCKMILAEVKEDLEEENVPFNRQLPIGTMIEVPSAAIMADQLAREVDFFSVGTNDLIQYTLAADRGNETVASLYSPGDPAVLKLLDHVVKAAGQANIAINVCGEMSGQPIYTQLLLGLGLRQLSATPHNIPEIKKLIRSTTIDEANRVAQEAMSLDTSRDVNYFLREQTRRILPELVG
jgi:phosphotransferase system enzyme I (PtsI)